MPKRYTLGLLLVSALIMLVVCKSHYKKTSLKPMKTTINLENALLREKIPPRCDVSIKNTKSEKDSVQRYNKFDSKEWTTTQWVIGASWITLAISAPFFIA